MKKIEARNLGLLVGGENIILALYGEVVAMWTIPHAKDRYDKTMECLQLLRDEHPQLDFFAVVIKEVKKPTYFANWYCTKDEDSEVTHRTFSRKEYLGLKESLTDKTVFKIT